MKTLLKKVNIGKNSSYKTTYYEIVEHNDKKFLIYVEFSNGDCLGFNRKCCLSVMNTSGSWDGVVDNRELGFNHENDKGTYCNDGILKDALLKMKANEFKKYIKAVY